MATIDRFKETIASGKITGGGATVPLSAQMKYDYLAAVHTMEQLENLAAAIETRKQYRAKLKAEVLSSCREELEKIAAEELTLKKIDAVINMLRECRKEVARLESADKESEKLAKYIRDGVAAG